MTLSHFCGSSPERAKIPAALPENKIYLTLYTITICFINKLISRIFVEK
jgi:hypothetical protein